MSAGNDMVIAVGSMLAGQLDPEKDLLNPGWRVPRYLYEVVRHLAHILRSDQQAVAQELFYSAMLGQAPGGVLRRIDRKYITKLVQEAYRQAGGTE